MDKIITINGEGVFSPAIRVYAVLLLPIIAFVQFFFPYPLILAVIIAILLLLIGIVGFTLHYTYQYDTEKMLYRKSKVTLGFYFGQWEELNTKNCYVAFQMFNQNYEINFMNMYTTATNEDVFIIRLVNSDGSYFTCAETTDYKSLNSCLLFCKVLSEKYEIPFRDFVKDLVLKRRRK